MSTTERLPDFTGLTFEKVWAMFQETDKKFQEDRKQAEEDRKQFREQMKENDRKFQETWEQMKKETDQFIKESQKRIEKSEAKMHKEIGHLGNRMGDVIEHMIATGVKRHFNALGFHFTEVMLHREIVDPDTGRTLTELDVVLENGEYIIVVEIKTKPNAADIKKHIQRLHIFRESRDRFHPGDAKKIYGAIASPVFPQENYDAAIAAGFYTVTQSGKAVVVNVPEGFLPRAF